MVVLKIAWIKQGGGGDTWVVQSIKHPTQVMISGAPYGALDAGVSTVFSPLETLSPSAPPPAHTYTNTHMQSLSLKQINK